MNRSGFGSTRQLIVTGYEWKPQVWVTILPTTIKIKGPLADLLDYVSDSANISYTLIPPKEEQSGVQLEAGVWTGMMGMLHRKEADMSVTPLLMTDERLEAVSFTFPVFIGNIKILLGRPGKTQGGFSLFSAFDNQVWMVFGCSFCVFVLLLYVIRRRLDDSPQTFGDQIWDMVVRTFSQDSPVPMTTTSVRLLTVFWVLLIMIIMNLYGGKMKSLLTLSSPTDFIKDIDDFLRFPKVKPILHKGSNEVDYFKSSRKDPQAGIWKRIMHDPERSMVHGDHLYSHKSMDQIENCKRAVFQEWRVFKDALAGRFKDRGSCRFSITPPYRIIPVGVGFRKDISVVLLEQVNLNVLYMLQGNLIDYLFPPTRDDYLRCLSDDDMSITPLVWRDVISGIYVWLVGMGSAFFSLLVEMTGRVCRWAYHRTRSRFKKRHAVLIRRRNNPTLQLKLIS